MAEEQAGDRPATRIGSQEWVEAVLADFEMFASRRVNRLLYGPGCGADRVRMMRALEEREAAWQRWKDR